MVAGVLSLTRNGLRDWILQRISAVVLAVYAIYLIGFLLMHPYLHYLQWLALFHHTWFRIFSLLTLVSIVMHAWIGIWTVFTDYVHPYWLRGILQTLLVLSLLALLFWGIEILWGIY